MTRTTFIDEIQDPVTGEVHRIEAPTEAELDAATEALRRIPRRRAVPG